ncbi:MAG: hypothetical protein HYX34_01020 [Actinobacteria bacterium]|nr:hypothetical protein [Actinomycetota bacterium]
MPAQPHWRVRFEWGVDGALALAPVCRAVVIVDVLRFTTCVEVALSAGAAAAHDVSVAVPVLVDGAFRAQAAVAGG